MPLAPLTKVLPLTKALPLLDSPQVSTRAYHGHLPRQSLWALMKALTTHSSSYPSRKTPRTLTKALTFLGSPQVSLRQPSIHPSWSLTKVPLARTQAAAQALGSDPAPDLHVVALPALACAP
eukprot:scaffold24589_cov20-Tisochrysis_lutea.AAC.3